MILILEKEENCDPDTFISTNLKSSRNCSIYENHDDHIVQTCCLAFWAQALTFPAVFNLTFETFHLNWNVSILMAALLKQHLILECSPRPQAGGL